MGRMGRVTSLSKMLVTLSGPVLVGCGDCGDDRASPASGVRIIGHRGSGDSAPENPWPENTLPSIEAAMRHGADGVEVDVRLSADGVLVLMHDGTVDRTTDGAGCVNGLTLEALKGLDAGRPAMSGEAVRVPTFGEVLRTVDRGVINVELKVRAANDPCEPTRRGAMVAALLADLEGFPRERVLVSSFDVEILERLRAEDPSIRIGLLSKAPGSPRLAQARGFEVVALRFGAVSAEVLEDARARGVRVWAWTLDEEQAMERLLPAGIDAVITNDVPLAQAVKERIARGSAK